MKLFIAVMAAVMLFVQAQSQVQEALKADSLVVPESQALDIQFLIAEALMHNPEIRAAQYAMDEADAKIPQEGSLDYPELLYMRDAMPDFYLNRLELSQTFRFPSKLAAQNELARIRSEHEHHTHLEKINEIISTVKSEYYELWFAQQGIILNHENTRLLRQFSKIAQVNYGVGMASQQDVLKIQVELAKLDNECISLRQRELSAKTKLMALLNRAPNDTLGFAVISESVEFNASLDSITNTALHLRPMIVHDSLSIEESKTMLSLSRQEYIPDFKIGVQHVTSPFAGFSGWNVTASVSIPFAPWTISKTSGRVDEASASMNKSTAEYTATKNMIISNVHSLYFQADASKRQLDSYRISILPKAEQSMNATLASYQVGHADFLSLIDSYRTLISLRTEYFMLRLQFEQTIAELERTVGSQYVSTMK